MLSPGIYLLGNITALGAAGTYVTDTVDNVPGAVSLTWWLNFTWTSGGTTCTCYLQTSFDKAANWADIAAHQFTTSTAKRFYNVVSTTSSANITPSDAGLTAGTILTGATLGDRFRMKYVLVGTYVAALEARLALR